MSDAPPADTCCVCGESSSFTKTMKRRKRAGERTCIECCAKKSTPSAVASSAKPAPNPGSTNAGGGGRKARPLRHAGGGSGANGGFDFAESAVGGDMPNPICFMCGARHDFGKCPKQISD